MPEGMRNYRERFNTEASSGCIKLGGGGNTEQGFHSTVSLGSFGGLSLGLGRALCLCLQQPTEARILEFKWQWGWLILLPTSGFPAPVKCSIHISSRV